MSKRTKKSNSKIAPASGLLETMTIEQVRAFKPEVVVIPVGSTEPHGPHLPYGTDLYIVDGITAEAVPRANAEKARVLRLPPLPISNNVNFKKFPFACRISVETLMAVLMDIVTALREDGVRKIVIVNGHGGNDATIKASLRQIYDRFQQEIFVCACYPFSFAGEAVTSKLREKASHAGEVETALVMHLFPDQVRSDLLRPGVSVAPVFAAMRAGLIDWVPGWNLILPESFGERPDLATPKKGQKFFEDSAAGLARFLVELSRQPWSPAFPFPVRK